MFFGGVSYPQNNFFNDVFIVDQADTLTPSTIDSYAITWEHQQTTGLGPTPRADHTAIAISETKMLVFGGRSMASGFLRYLNDAYILDTSSTPPTWEKLYTTGPKPGVRSGHTAVVHQNKMYVFGGQSDQGYYNDLFALDLGNYHWEKVKSVGKLPEPRAGHVAVIHGDRIFITCGASSTAVYSDLFSYNFEFKRWQ